jgi:hypothetical protein
MAVTCWAGSIAEAAPPRGSYTMSLMSGWDLIPPERGGRPLCAGDLILLLVCKPAPPVSCPTGWSLLGEYPWTDEEGRAHMGTAFWKIIGPPEKEMPPTFTAPGESEWEIRGQAITGYTLTGDPGLEWPGGSTNDPVGVSVEEQG